MKSKTHRFADHLRRGLVVRFCCPGRDAASSPDRSPNARDQHQFLTRQTIEQRTFHHTHAGSRRRWLPLRLGQDPPQRRRVQQSVVGRARHERFAQGGSRSVRTTLRTVQPGRFAARRHGPHGRGCGSLPQAGLVSEHGSQVHPGDDQVRGIQRWSEHCFFVGKSTEVGSSVAVHRSPKTAGTCHWTDNLRIWPSKWFAKSPPIREHTCLPYILGSHKQELS